MDEADSAVVRRVCDGDQGAFRILVDRHSRDLFYLAYRMTANRSDAEDLVQETFLRAYRHLSRFDQRAEFRTWLHSIAVNCSLDMLRRRQRHKAAGLIEGDAGSHRVGRAAADSPAPDRLVLGEQIRRTVHSKLSQLSPMERTAFLLRHVEGMSIDEISQVIGRKSGATKNCIFQIGRAR